MICILKQTFEARKRGIVAIDFVASCEIEANFSTEKSLLVTVNLLRVGGALFPAGVFAVIVSRTRARARSVQIP